MDLHNTVSDWAFRGRPVSDPATKTLWQRGARFASYANLASTFNNPGGGTSINKLRELIDKAEANPSDTLQGETEVMITQDLSQMITKHLPEAQDMDDEARLALSIDSLMAIEVKNWVRRNLQIDISLTEISKARTIGV
ncbi:hypothetical protein ETB97_007254 [Aspergillus alliaceus]|uniref:Carrier domain-containing protein n=1 Tax=Petromyces alliaceus TaxID=209559 RepID=A0A8H5ZTG8_PETAA|nr:hypothetical protein ETB97_007254 [Aspergillus burnettii]